MQAGSTGASSGWEDDDDDDDGVRGEYHDGFQAAPTSSLRLLAPTGQGVSVGRMTGAAFRSDLSPALVQRCTKTSVMASDAFTGSNELPAPTPREILA